MSLTAKQTNNRSLIDGTRNASKRGEQWTERVSFHFLNNFQNTIICRISTSFFFSFFIRFCQADVNKDGGPLKQTSCSENTIATRSSALLSNYSKRIETSEKLFSSLIALHVWEYQYTKFDFTNPQEIQASRTNIW